MYIQGRIGKQQPGMLQSMGLQRSDMTEPLNNIQRNAAAAAAAAAKSLQSCPTL